MKTRFTLLAALVLLAGSLSAWQVTGSMQISTEPSGATISLAGTGIYLGTTPTQQFNMQTAQNAFWFGGMLGHVFDLQITKNGYYPLIQRVFIPISVCGSSSSPTVLHFRLTPIPPAYYYPVDYKPPVYQYYSVDSNKKPGQHHHNPPHSHRAQPSKPKPNKKPQGHRH